MLPREMDGDPLPKSWRGTWGELFQQPGRSELVRVCWTLRSFSNKVLFTGQGAHVTEMDFKMKAFIDEPEKKTILPFTGSMRGLLVARGQGYFGSFLSSLI